MSKYFVVVVNSRKTQDESEQNPQRQGPCSPAHLQTVVVDFETWYCITLKTSCFNFRVSLPFCIFVIKIWSGHAMSRLNWIIVRLPLMIYPKRNVITWPKFIMWLHILTEWKWMRHFTFLVIFHELNSSKFSFRLSLFFWFAWLGGINLFYSHSHSHVWIYNIFYALILSS